MKEHIDKTITLSPEILNHVNEWKDKPGNLIMILHKVQEEYGLCPERSGPEADRAARYPAGKSIRGPHFLSSF